MNPLTIALLLAGATVTAVAFTRRSGETGRPRPGEDVPVGTPGLPPPTGTAPTGTALDDPRFAAFRAASAVPRASSDLLAKFYNDPSFDASDFVYTYRSLSEPAVRNTPEQRLVWILNAPSVGEQPSEQARKRALRGLAAILRSATSPLQVVRSAFSESLRNQIRLVRSDIETIESPAYGALQTAPTDVATILTALESKYGIRFTRPAVSIELPRFLAVEVPRVLRQLISLYEDRLAGATRDEERNARIMQYRQPIRRIPIVPPQLVRDAAATYQAAGLTEQADFLDRVASAANAAINDPNAVRAEQGA